MSKAIDESLWDMVERRSESLLQLERDCVRRGVPSRFIGIEMYKAYWKITDEWVMSNHVKEDK